MKTPRPGIASANRPRLGSFASLIDQVLDDEDALDGLAFAYAELAEPERRALAEAVLQDAGNPTQALAAFLAVEEDSRLRQRLAGLIRRHGRVDQTAFLEGTETQGVARLVQSLSGFEPESLRITWNACQIENIEIESRKSLENEPSLAALGVAKAMETLTPLLWRYIQSGGQLPDGAERFAGFFSVG